MTDIEQQQQKQQQHEEAQPQATNTSPASAHSPSQHHDSGYGDESFGHHDTDSRNRPQSRASQYSSHNGESSSEGHAGGHQHRKQSYAGAGQLSSYQLQQLQFEEPGRSSDDDMW